LIDQLIIDKQEVGSRWSIRLLLKLARVSSSFVIDHIKFGDDVEEEWVDDVTLFDFL